MPNELLSKGKKCYSKKEGWKSKGFNKVAKMVKELLTPSLSGTYII